MFRRRKVYFPEKKCVFYKIIIMRLIVTFLICAVYASQVVYARKNSVLAEGEWYKVAVTETGVYSISYDDLRDMGVDIASIDPKKIAIYGNGGKMLPQKNSDIRPEDLVENAIWVSGEDDGIFSEEDAIVFYAEGPNIWSYNDKENAGFQRVFNLYSDTTYYFLLLNKSEDGKRLEEKTRISTAGTVLTSYNERIFYEKDLINVNETGRIWLGETFDENLDKTFRFDVEGMVGSNILMNLAVAGSSSRYNSGSLESKPFMNVYLDQHFIDTVKFSTNIVLSENYYIPVTHRVIREYNLERQESDNLLAIRLKYDKNGVLSPSPTLLYAGFLDYIELFFERTLDLRRETQLAFRSVRTLEDGTYTFSLRDAGTGQIWDVTDPFLPARIPSENDGDAMTFTVEGGALREYIAFKEYNKPRKILKVPNQNIRGLDPSDMIIFTAPGLKSQAERLADFHRSHNGYKVHVLTTNEVYNEFSSGKRDLSAIRDACRYFYNIDGRLKYLLLFGLGSSDYKSVDGDAANYIPIYQSRESFSPLSSYASDDYFAFLEDDEGEWLETSSRSHHHTMDIAVGRLPVSNLKEAAICVDKIIAYSTDPATLGRWRSNIAYVADDGETNLFLRESEAYAQTLSMDNPAFSARKLYFARYPKVVNDLGDFSEALTRDLVRVINEGALIVNYTGHGAPRRLGRGMIDRDRAVLWKNKDRLAFFITGTCEFALADKPGVYSLGRELFLFKDYGGVGIFSGTRAAYATSNNLIVKNVMKNIFNPEMAVGEVIRLAKNESFSGIRNRHFTYLGDPALKLNIPVNKVKITSVNGAPSGERDTLKALVNIRLRGVVEDREGVSLGDFNGQVHITVFDKEKKITTLGQADPVTTFNERAEELYSGQAKVENGEFEMEFMLPVQAADSIGSAKIRLYAVADDGRDALGADLNYWTGGIDPGAEKDFSEPEIIMYLDSLAFKNGDTVTSKPVLIAELYDDSGINLATGDPDNCILSYLNNDSVIVLTNYFIPDTGDVRKGVVRYPFYGLPLGDYNLSLRVSDLYNNQGYASIDFVVYEDISGIFHPGIASFVKINAFPNPFDHATAIRLEGEGSIIADVRISDMHGRLIKGMNGISVSSSSPISWDGKDESGAKVSAGVYACTINAVSHQKQYTVLLVVR